MLNGRRISDKWRILFAPTIEAASQPRKVDRLAEFLTAREAITLPRVNQRYIRNVEAAETQAATCIEVDSSSRMFLAGQYLIPVPSARPPSGCRRNWTASGIRSWAYGHSERMTS